LLSRLDSEVQLATILGHEIAHITNRHAFRVMRDGAMGAVTGLAGVAGAASRASRGDQVGVAVLSQTARALFGGRLQLAALASIRGYGKDLEREADVDGMDKLVSAGYDPREAPKVFDLLQKDLKNRGELETFFFGDHRALAGRMASTSRLVKGKYGAAATRAQTFRAADEWQLRMRAVVRENAQLGVRAGRFDLAQQQLDRVLAITPNDPLAYLYHGDLYRLKSQRARGLDAKARNAKLALASYEKAMALDPALPDPYRQLGFLYYQEKNTPKAKEAFEKYLALAPDAPDAKRVTEYLVGRE